MTYRYYVQHFGKHVIFYRYTGPVTDAEREDMDRLPRAGSRYAAHLQRVQRLVAGNYLSWEPDSYLGGCRTVGLTLR